MLEKLKENAFALPTDVLEDRKNIQRKFIINLCEEIAFCYLKDNNGKKSIDALKELDILHDIIKTKNVKAVMYMARSYLLIKNFEKAYDYFSAVYSMVDENLKSDIAGMLNSIKKSIEEQKCEKRSKDDIEDQILERKKTDLYDLCKDDISLVPLNEQFDNDESDEQIKEEKFLKAKNDQSNKNSVQKTADTVTINAQKTSTTILTEFMSKFGDAQPLYELINTVKSRNNEQIFTFSCYCIRHTVEGSGKNMKSAKENAAAKMIKHLQATGKLILINSAQ